MKAITIDGPAGVGKSTLAKELAEELGLPALDTGAMFRFLALNLGAGAANLGAEELRPKARAWRFSLQGSGKDTRLLVNGQPIGSEIRTDAAARLASGLARNPSARGILREAQRELAAGHALVAEGRDMGTVVFPDADLKFFLDARPDVRALRRWNELAAKDQAPDLAELEQSIRQRDEQDRGRPVAPLKPAPDAIIIDTSDLAIPEVLALMKAAWSERQR